MSTETALVFDVEGNTIAIHEPPCRTGSFIPDSFNLYEVLWGNRHRLGGVAHTHPWYGPAWYSEEDRTTFSAVDLALGKRLVWVVVTFSEAVYYKWHGPGRYDYEPIGYELAESEKEAFESDFAVDYKKFPLPEFRVTDTDKLRDMSR